VQTVIIGYFKDKKHADKALRFGKTSSSKAVTCAAAAMLRAHKQYSLEKVSGMLTEATKQPTMAPPYACSLLR